VSATLCEHIIKAKFRSLQVTLTNGLDCKVYSTHQVVII